MPYRVELWQRLCGSQSLKHLLSDLKKKFASCALRGPEVTGVKKQLSTLGWGAVECEGSLETHDRASPQPQVEIEPLWRGFSYHRSTQLACGKETCQNCQIERSWPDGVAGTVLWPPGLNWKMEEGNPDEKKNLHATACEDPFDALYCQILTLCHLAKEKRL